jgi:hypothetical protein
MEVKRHGFDASKLRETDFLVDCAARILLAHLERKGSVLSSRRRVQQSDNEIKHHRL